MVDDAVFHDDDALGAGGDFIAVGDEDDGFAVGVEFVEEVEDFEAGLGIEVAGGFVGEDEERVVDEGAGDGDALLLAAGELLGTVIEAMAEADELREGDAVCVAVGEVAALIKERDVDVLDDGELVDEVVGLEDEAERAAAKGGELVVIHRGDVLPAEEIFAGGRAVEAAEDVEEGGFSRAGRAHDGDVGTGFDDETDAAERVNLDVAHRVGLVELLDADDFAGSHRGRGKSYLAVTIPLERARKPQRHNEPRAAGPQPTRSTWGPGWMENSDSFRLEYAVRALPPFSLSAFFPISAVFSGNALIVGARSGTPPRSERTQSGKEPGEMPQARTADAQRGGRNAAVREWSRVGQGNLGPGNGRG